MTLVPLLGVAILELALRVGGYGYPTSFFIKNHIHGRTVFVENDRFGLGFFPAALARSPAPVVLPADKPTNTYRIFVLGESAALGDPEPAFGFGRYLEILLRDRFPGTRFEVVCVAMTAINSHAILPIARECARHQGDLWVVYAGNNEMMGPFGAGTILGARAPRLGLVRASVALKRTRVGQLLDSGLSVLGAKGRSTNSWEGMKMFTEHQVPLDDPGRRRVYQNFKGNLEDILRAGQAAGVRIVLSTVASNLRDCGPFASLHATGLNERQRSDWERLFSEGRSLETSGRFSEALDRYSQAAQLDHEFAELQFRLARCYLALTNLDQARRCFELARDCDALPFRTDSTLNAAIKETAAEFSGKGVALLDAVDTFAQAGTIPGNDFFYEHVHLNFTGNYLLARAVAEQIALALPSSIAGRGKAEWPAAEICDRRLGVTDWDRHRLYENVLQRATEPPFALQPDHDNHLQTLLRNLAEINSRMDPTARRQAREAYQQILKEDPDDFLQHGNFARFLEDTGDLAGAVAEWKQVEELLPYHFGPSFYLGKLYARMGKYPEAEHALNRTLQLHPDIAEALDELGQVLTRQKRTAEALVCLKHAVKLQPSNARFYFHVAEALGAQNERDAAMDNLRKAVQLRPEYWEARYFLGVELAVRDNISEAYDQFREVVHLKPDYAPAHLNLGVALANQGKFDDALAEFQETLRLDPKNKSAQQRVEGIRLLKSRPPP
jgi:tetratricopeptide (TPR) repeat protein